MSTKTETGLPVIQTQRLFINKLTPDDVKAFYAYRTHPDIVRYQGTFPEDEEQVQQLLINQSNVDFGMQAQWFQFAIRLQPEQTIIGDIGLRYVSPFIPQAEIAYTISAPYQRKGYAREGVQAFLDYCFSTLNLKIISATIDIRNIASVNLLKNLGFKRIALRPHASYIRGEWCDEADYGLFVEKWQNSKI